MKTLEEIKQILTDHKTELQERYSVQDVGIFGSYVRGDQNPGSDVDVLVSFSRPIGWDVVDVHDYLEQILGTKVDMVTKRAAMGKPLLWRSIQEDLVHV